MGLTPLRRAPWPPTRKAVELDPNFADAQAGYALAAALVSVFNLDFFASLDSRSQARLRRGWSRAGARPQQRPRLSGARGPPAQRWATCRRDRICAPGRQPRSA